MSGITPACAGRRIKYLLPALFIGDHPRVCGEKYTTAVAICQHLGSPPRVRGEGLSSASQGGRDRITPACAGRSCTGSRPRPRLRDHPRVCGEKACPFSVGCWFWGSPPRVRGEGTRRPKPSRMSGITPACAGRRSARPANTGACTDHPRVCGEKTETAAPRHSRAGSPPRVRGEDRRQTANNPRPRITPACAGRSTLNGSKKVGFWDHPRVCGEKFAPLPPASFAQGSPPRVRGEVFGSTPTFSMIGITPACAGRSRRPWRCRPLSWDHPRVCGEKAQRAQNLRRAGGSPPRVRGEALVCVIVFMEVRITPACAGRSAVRA